MDNLQQFPVGCVVLPTAEARRQHIYSHVAGFVSGHSRDKSCIYVSPTQGMRGTRYSVAFFARDNRFVPGEVWRNREKGHLLTITGYTRGLFRGVMPNGEERYSLLDHTTWEHVPSAVTATGRIVPSGKAAIVDLLNKLSTAVAGLPDNNFAAVVPKWVQ